MSKYIEADATRDLLIRSISLTNGIDTALREAPSIDLVRCGECKYHNGEYCFRLVAKDAWDLIGSQCVITMQPDDFCSYGQRKGTNDE